MTPNWLKGLKKQRQWHLDLARRFRAGKEPNCGNPEVWARYHRGEAMKLARIINGTAKR